MRFFIIQRNEHVGLVAQSPHFLIADSRMGDAATEPSNFSRVGIKGKHGETGSGHGFVENTAGSDGSIPRHSAYFNGQIHFRHIKTPSTRRC